MRALILAANPAIAETIKRTNRPYCVLQGKVCGLLAMKDHVNVFIYDPAAPDPAEIMNQGQGNKTARTIQLEHGDTLNETAFIDLIRAVVANNREGEWRRFQRTS